ncbi:MAG: Gluconolactonase family protein [Rhodoferax sp.]|nr:Gluconolactonase family protein [Rhodoferax sp.]
MLTSIHLIRPLHSTIERIPLKKPFVGMFAWPVSNQVGESPVWDGYTDTLLWIDVRGQTVLRLDPARRALTQWELPQVIGALALVQPQQVLLALKRQLALLCLDTGTLSLFAPIVDEPAGNRLNEGKLSPSGRWFVFGSMDDRPEHKQPTGSLYRADLQGNVVKLHHGLTIANGIAWSPDGRTIFFSDSFAGTIWHAVWGEDEGTMASPLLFAASDEASGRPDGALVDLAGRYVSAGVSAGCINVFGPGGQPLLKLALPVRAPTMPCVGGVGGSRLFVTSLVRNSWSKDGTFDGCLLDFNRRAWGI